MIEVTLVSMGPLAEWGPGQIAPVAPPPSRRLCHTVTHISQTGSLGFNYTHQQLTFLFTINPLA